MSTSLIYEDTDPSYMRAVKYVFYALAYLTFGWWLLPLRDFCRKRGWNTTVLVLNNVPNGLTVLRGGISVPIVTLFMLHLWQENQEVATWYFFGLVGLFLLDAIDGPLARMLDYQTQWGAKADPVADKALVYSLALGLPFIVFHFQGPFAAGSIVFFLGWMGFVERRIVRTSLNTNRLSILTGEELHGAFGAGKAKFCFQAIGLAASYGALIWWPTSPTGSYIACVCFVAARWFADKSLGDHRAEESRLHKEAMQRGLYEGREAA